MKRLKQIISIILCLTLCVGLLPMAASAESPPAISYLDAIGETQTCTKYEELVNKTGASLYANDKWYIVKGEVTITSSLVVSQNSNLILCDGATLNVNYLRITSGATLTIYSQSLRANMGTLNVNEQSPDNTQCVGITITTDDSSLIVNGGNINATTKSCSESTGIYLYEGNLIVNNGKVTATGADVVGVAEETYLRSYGISGDSSTITVNGGELIAKSGKAQIGTSGKAPYSMGMALYSTTLNITGGTVTVESGSADNPGRSSGIYMGTINMSGGKLTVTAPKESNANPYYYTTFNYSGGEVKLPYGSEMQEITVSGNAKLTDLLGDKCYYMGTGNQPIAYSTLANKTKLESVAVYFCNNTHDYTGGATHCTRCNWEKNVSYLDYDESEGKFVTAATDSYTLITDEWVKENKTKSGVAVSKPGNYVVKGKVTIDGTLWFNEEANLILYDNAELEVKGGVIVADSLRVYAQSTGTSMGKLTVNGEGLAIIVNPEKTLKIYGGKVTATGEDSTSKSYGVYANVLEVYGGELIATGGKAPESAGIYIENSTGDHMSVLGGKVTATGATMTDTTNASTKSYGIYLNSDLTVSGGEVTASGGDLTVDGSGESYGIYQDKGTTTVTSGKLTANGGKVTTTRTLNSNWSASYGMIHNFANYAKDSLVVTGGTVSVNAGDVIAPADNSENTGSTGFGGKYVNVSGGTVTVTVGKATSKSPYGNSPLTVSGGTVKLPEDSWFASLKVVAPVTFGDLLARNCMYTKNGTSENPESTPIKLSELDGETELTDVTVVACTEHSYVGGKCEYCGGSQPSAGAPVYNPTVVQPSVGGSVEVNNPSPSEGETIVVTPKNDDGYVVDTITVTDEAGNKLEISRNNDGSFDFIQPSGNVTIEVTYKEKPEFNDVPANAWYKEALEKAVKYGIVSGTSKNTFEPNEPMTRAMFATVLWNYAGKPTGFTANFKDVKSGDWFYQAVAWASNKNVISGMGNGKFEPDDEITREQMVTMLWNFCGKPSSTVKLNNFTDSGKISDWAQTAMAWAVENDIISGRGNGVLDPLSTATRAEVTAMILNFISK